MSTNKNTLRFYAREARHHKPSMALAFIFMPLMALSLDTLMPYYLSLAIGDLTTGNSEAITGHLIMAGVFGLLGIASNLIGFQAFIRNQSRVVTRLYNMVFVSLLHKDLKFFVDERVGALTSRLIDFVRTYSTLQTLVIIRSIGYIISLVVGLGIVAVNAPVMALMLVMLFFLMLILIRVFIKIRAPYRHERKILVGEIHGEIADSITNSLLVKTFKHEKYEIDHLSKKLRRFETLSVKDYGILGYDGTIRIFVTTVTQILGISIAAYLVLNGQLSIAIAVFSLSYLQYVASQLFRLGDLIVSYDEAFLQAGPMSDILMRPVTVTDSPHAKNHTIKEPSIHLKGVSYHYTDNKKDVVDNISLYIPTGQKVGLVGRSGAGKTTVAHLLLRFFDVTGGSIEIDGVDLRDFTQESLREQIAYVPQEPMLFHRTLRENIAYGNLAATDEQIREAARQANALEFIDTLPNGMDTLVGERGVKLSGGQRQRIAIARAILKNAPILILDEATSALDSQSERLIQGALEKLMKGRTSIVIAHRLSTISKLDRIIVMDKGRTAEDGTHEELLKHGGIYATLWSHQSGGFIEE